MNARRQLKNIRHLASVHVYTTLFRDASYKNTDVSKSKALEKSVIGFKEDMDLYIEKRLSRTLDYNILFAKTMTLKNTMLVTYNIKLEVNMAEIEVGGEILAMQAKNSNFKVQIALIEAGIVVMGKVGAIMVKDNLINLYLYATGTTILGI